MGYNCAILPGDRTEFIPHTLFPPAGARCNCAVRFIRPVKINPSWKKIFFRKKNKVPRRWLDLAELPEKNVIQQEATDPRRWAIYPRRAHSLLVMDTRKRTNSPSDGRRGFTSCNHRVNITQQHCAAAASTPSVRTWRWILKWLDPRWLIICCVFPLWSHFSLWGKQPLRASRHSALSRPAPHHGSGSSLLRPSILTSAFTAGAHPPHKWKGAGSFCEK